jgi:hypothetical protein
MILLLILALISFLGQLYWLKVNFKKPSGRTFWKKIEMKDPTGLSALPKDLTFIN